MYKTALHTGMHKPTLRKKNTNAKYKYWENPRRDTRVYWWETAYGSMEKHKKIKNSK
jgi:hypothetical protein